MKNRRNGICGLIALLALTIPGLALANKGSVTIDAPDTAQKGQEVTIKLNVSHCCVSGMHHVDWVYLQVNGAEMKRWTYTSNDLPPSNNFTLEYKYKVMGDTELKAEANCNLHGSAGPAVKTIKVNSESTGY